MNWKRALLLFWGIIAFFLVTLGTLNTTSATRLHFRFFKDWQSLTIYGGEISYSRQPFFGAGRTPASSGIRFERVPITKWTKAELFKNYFASASGSGPRYSPFYFYEKDITSTSLTTLFLLHTTFSTLAYILLQSHYRKKTAALPAPPECGGSTPPRGRPA